MREYSGTKYLSFSTNFSTGTDALTLEEASPGFPIIDLNLLLETMVQLMLLFIPPQYFILSKSLDTKLIFIEDVHTSKVFPNTSLNNLSSDLYLEEIG